MSDDKHPDFEKLGIGEAAGGAFLGAVVGVFVGVIVSAATYSNKVSNPALSSLGSSILTWAVICGGIGLVLGLVSLSVNASRHTQYKREREAQAAAREREKLLQIEEAKKNYAAAYSAYLPKWQAWHKEYRQHVAELTSHTAWERDAAAAFGPLRDRMLAAIEAFKSLHMNIDTRSRLDLELTSKTHRQALFQEAFLEAARQYRDFGLFRLLETDPVLAARIPELEKFRADEGLALVQAILPPLPSVPPVLRQVRQKPEPPPRPEAPRGILFWQNGGMVAAPVPPEKVVFTPN